MQTQPTLEMHEPAATIAALWFVILNPVIAFILCAMAAWWMN